MSRALTDITNSSCISPKKRPGETINDNQKANKRDKKISSLVLSKGQDKALHYLEGKPTTM
jgi:hypothetical protein